jgi:serine/threonine-protein kinase
MALAPGARLGPYEIAALIGEGGMGKVWRAHHTALNRDDALKVLPEAFASDPDRLARFRREAQVLASLNHPNIAHVYGLEQADGAQALVMELVDGPTLADRIAQGPIPVDEVMPIAKQIAEALEAAHEQGIIHRDLKPANIKMRADGTVKVLDFGLAKLAEPSAAAATGSSPLSLSPTITSPALMTGVGALLGTAAYMSPEQAKRRPADKRSDIWAFGCVLYEMLTGKRPFDGEDVTDVLGAVVRLEPNWTALPSELPSAVRALLRGCLVKDQRHRISDISVARFVLDHLSSLSTADDAKSSDSGYVLKATAATKTASSVASAVAETRRGLIRSMRRRIALVAAAGLLAAAAVGASVWVIGRPTAPRVVRLDFATAGASALSISGASPDLAITRDGSHVVFRGRNGLFVRALNQLTVTQLAGRAINPFVSPDGQWVGFFGQGGLWKVAISGGPPVGVSATIPATARGATWNEEGTIVYAIAGVGGLYRVPAAGGEPTRLTTPDVKRGEGFHFWPEFLPGGDALLFTILPPDLNPAAGQIALLDLRTHAQMVVIHGGTHARYVSSGYLVYAAGGALRAVAFDPTRHAVVGTPVPVVESVQTSPQGGVDAALAADGTLVYLPGGLANALRRVLVSVGRDGREEIVAGMPARQYTYPRISPDGTQVALDIRDQEQDIWIWSFVRRTLTRLTFGADLDSIPVWTFDGQRLVWGSRRPLNLYWQNADGSGPMERLTDSPNEQRASSVTPDGRYLLLAQDTVATINAPARDIAMLPLSGDRKLSPLIHTMFDERNAEVSPDGRWVAYESNESGQFEVYVRPFPRVDDGRWQVSAGGGRQPAWARNARELFFWGADGALMAASVEGARGGARFTSGTPMKLIEARSYYEAEADANLGRTYDISPDGQRFLMIKPAGDQNATANLVVVQHLDEELKLLVPTK